MMENFTNPMYASAINAALYMAKLAKAAQDPNSFDTAAHQLNRIFLDNKAGLFLLNASQELSTSGRELSLLTSANGLGWDWTGIQWLLTLLYPISNLPKHLQTLRDLLKDIALLVRVDQTRLEAFLVVSAPKVPLPTSNSTFSSQPVPLPPAPTAVSGFEDAKSPVVPGKSPHLIGHPGPFEKPSNSLPKGPQPGAVASNAVSPSTASKKTNTRSGVGGQEAPTPRPLSAQSTGSTAPTGPSGPSAETPKKSGDETKGEGRRIETATGSGAEFDAELEKALREGDLKKALEMVPFPKEFDESDDEFN